MTFIFSKVLSGSSLAILDSRNHCQAFVTRTRAVTTIGAVSSYSLRVNLCATAPASLFETDDFSPENRRSGVSRVVRQDRCAAGRCGTSGDGRGHGFTTGRLETITRVGRGRNVQRAIELASPGEVVCGAGAGAFVPDLYRNDQGIGESDRSRHTARNEAIVGETRADVRRHEIALYACRTRGPANRPAEGAVSGEGAQRNLGEACSHERDHRAV